MTRRRTFTRAGLAAAALAWAATPAPAAQWRVPRDFRTIQAAIDSPRVGDDDVILVGPGRHHGAVVTKAVEIRGNGKAVIVDGPAGGRPSPSGRPASTSPARARAAARAWSGCASSASTCRCSAPGPTM